jgi:hypothetical protein
MGGKVLVPTREAVAKLVAARLAADVMGVPTVIVARTDADSASLITSDADPYDHSYITGERTSEGFFHIKNGVELVRDFEDPGLVWGRHDQLNQVWKLRRVLNALAADGSSAPGLELLIDKLKTTKSNDEFLSEIAKNPTPGA